MKAIMVYTEKEIRVGLMIVLILSAVFTTFKIRELQTRDLNKADLFRTELTSANKTIFKPVSEADATLIEEPVTFTQTPARADVASGNEVAVQLKTWMNNKAYWNGEEVENERALTEQMTTWLKNGTFISDETFQELPADQAEYQLNNADEGYNTELKSEMKTWIACGNYWSEANN